MHNYMQLTPKPNPNPIFKYMLLITITQYLIV